jgi:hypothetical protein
MGWWWVERNEIAQIFPSAQSSADGDSDFVVLDRGTEGFKGAAARQACCQFAIQNRVKSKPLLKVQTLK